MTPAAHGEPPQGDVAPRRLPAGACDCHMHIFDERFSALPGALFRAAPVAAYRGLAESLGIDRMVVVQPSGYGFDNACTLDALAQLGEASRGVVVIAPDTPADELRRMHAQGVRGVRYMMLREGGLGWHSMAAMADAVGALGWHLNLQFDGHQLPERAAALGALPVDLVIDHFGAFLDGAEPDGAAFRTLLRLMESGRVWVKLSAPYAYRMSASGAPDFPEVGRLAAELISAFPERCLWATDWPHVTEATWPSDTALLALFERWAVDEATRQRILVDNPTRLYGFANASSGSRATAT